MVRPRLHDPDLVLDAAEALAVRSGPAAVTIRAVAAAANVSNGAIYHTFDSRAALLGRAWLRAARGFLAVQTDRVDSTLLRGDPAAAVAAAADAVALFAEQSPGSARLLSTVDRDQLLGADLPADVAADVAAVQGVLVDVLIRLAEALWDRRDASAVDVITMCVVDLPTAILLARNRLDDAGARARLREAVHAVLAVGPPPKAHSRVTDHQGAHR